jgi:hypothetical protein
MKMDADKIYDLLFEVHEKQGKISAHCEKIDSDIGALSVDIRRCNTSINTLSNRVEAIEASKRESHDWEEISSLHHALDEHIQRTDTSLQTFAAQSASHGNSISTHWKLIMVLLTAVGLLGGGTALASWGSVAGHQHGAPTAQEAAQGGGVGR